METRIQISTHDGRMIGRSIMYPVIHMENILKAGVTFVVLAMVLVIGSGVNVLTNTTVTGLVGAGSIAGNVANSANIAIVTFTNFLPVLAIAVVGGVAIAYIVGFFGSSTRT